MIPAFTPAHEFAEIFSLHEHDLLDLSKRIGANGLREPCVLLDGKMLDGRRRERACHKAGVKPSYRDFGSRKTDGDDPLEFVIDLNLHRRHLGEGERALAAAKYAKARDGKPSQLATVTEEPTNKDAAKKFDVSESKVDRAKKVVANGVPELQEAVADETITVSDAAKVADAKPSVQRKAVQDVKEGKTKSAAASATKAKNQTGKPLFDDKAVVDALGKLARLLDERARVYGKCAEHAECLSLLDKALVKFKQWQKR
jgi:ParB-like chromosome segregation protein Spo0J